MTLEALISALSLYAATGLLMSRAYTVDDLYRQATWYTGQRYQRGMTRAALGDLATVAAITAQWKAVAK